MDDAPLSISSDLHRRLSERAAATGHDGVDEYVEFVLREVLHQVDGVDASVDQEEVESRLQALGYVE